MQQGHRLSVVPRVLITQTVLRLIQRVHGGDSIVQAVAFAFGHAGRVLVSEGTGAAIGCQSIAGRFVPRQISGQAVIQGDQHQVGITRVGDSHLIGNRVGLSIPVLGIVRTHCFLVNLEIGVQDRQCMIIVIPDVVGEALWIEVHGNRIDHRAGHSWRVEGRKGTLIGAAGVIPVRR